MAPEMQFYRQEVPQPTTPTANMARKISRRIPKGHFKKRPDLMYWVDDEQPEEFDFTFDCPVCVVQAGGCGFLALNSGFCIWTDRDAAETYLERAADTLPDNPSGDTLDVVEIESDSDLLDLLMRAHAAGVEEIVVDLARPDQTFAQCLYVANVLDILRERID